MLGDLRTDALHEALRAAPVEAETLLGLLVLAFSALNVSVTAPATGNHYSRNGRGEIAAGLIEDGTLTVNTLTIVQAGRAMLAEVLSCRADASRSGAAATIAGLVLGADEHLPNLATAEFLGCMSRAEIEAAAQAANLPVKAKLKDTRDSLVAHYAEERFLPALAHFQLTEQEKTRLAEERAGEVVEDEAIEAGADTPASIQPDDAEETIGEELSDAA